MSEMTASERRPDFLEPPVIEVALSVAFQPVAGLGTVQLVSAWQQKFQQSYPNVEEQAPFEMPVEKVGEPFRGPSIQVQLVAPPLAPRLWLVNDAGTQLLQLQHNFFARNWRKRPAETDYPRYPSLVRSFEEDFAD